MRSIGFQPFAGSAAQHLDLVAAFVCQSCRLALAIVAQGAIADNVEVNAQFSVQQADCCEQVIQPFLWHQSANEEQSPVLDLAVRNWLEPVGISAAGNHHHRFAASHCKQVFAHFIANRYHCIGVGEFRGKVFRLGVNVMAMAGEGYRQSCNAGGSDGMGGRATCKMGMDVGAIIASGNRSDLERMP